MNLIMFYILTTGLLILPVVWLKTDYRNFKEQIKWHLGLERIIRNSLIVGLIILQYLLLTKYPSILLPGGIITTTIGIICYFLGLFLAIWAKLTMKSIWGTPAQHNIKRQHTLITKGPFSISRNPIYFGDLLVCISYFLILHSYLVFVSIPALFLINRIIKKEEFILEKHFGKKYLKYKEKVRRYI